MNRPGKVGIRLTLTMVAIFAVVLVFTGRLFDLQVVQAAHLSKQAKNARSATVVTPGIRGTITDTNGNVLADSVSRFDITVSPKQLVSGYFKKAGDASSLVPLSTTLAQLAAITGASQSDMQAVIDANPKSEFAYLVKGVTLSVYNKIVKLAVPGIYPVPAPKRSYPNGSIAGNLVGFVGTDGAQAGIELAYNSCLAATNGTATYEKGADGTRIPGSTITQKDAVNGGTVKLTIDRDLQWYVQKAIATQARAIGAKWATAVVERVSDGHLMAVADYPTVDPNNVSAAKRGALGSLAFSTPYEPGSTFKAMSMAALLDSGAITPSTKATIPAVYTNGLPKGAYIKDSYAHGTVHYYPGGVIENSSNVGISVLSQSLNKQARHDYMVKFGVGQKTAVDFGSQQSAGYLAPASKWDAITNRAVEFGQGVSATSVQVAQIFETLANHGVREPSTLVESCTKSDGTVVDTQKTKPVRVVSAQAANQVAKMMTTVPISGPMAPAFKDPAGYVISAKTGTAQVASTNGTGYTNDYTVSVAGFAPYNDPKYVVVVTFGKPSTLKTSAAAAPTFSEVMTEVLKKYRVEPSSARPPYVQTIW